MQTAATFVEGKTNFAFLSDVFSSILTLADGDVAYFPIGFQSLRTSLMAAKVHSYNTSLEALWVLYPLDTMVDRISKWDCQAPNPGDFDMISRALSAHYSWLKHTGHIQEDESTDYTDLGDWGALYEECICSQALVTRDMAATAAVDAILEPPGSIRAAIARVRRLLRVHEPRLRPGTPEGRLNAALNVSTTYSDTDRVPFILSATAAYIAAL